MPQDRDTYHYHASSKPVDTPSLLATCCMHMAPSKANGFQTETADCLSGIITAIDPTIGCVGIGFSKVGDEPTPG